MSLKTDTGGAIMKILKQVQPYFLLIAYAIWLLALFLPHPFLGMEYPSAHITILILPVLGGVNLLLALFYKRWTSALASLPLFLAFYITWFLGDILVGLFN